MYLLSSIAILGIHVRFLGRSWKNHGKNNKNSQKSLKSNLFDHHKIDQNLRGRAPPQEIAGPLLRDY